MRLGDFTPSITYDVKNSDDDFKFIDSISQMPGELQPLLFGLQTAFDDDSKSIILGLRYDFHTNVALKVDATRYTDKLDEDNDAELIRFAVNYVF
jgi:hypothetical protein